MVAPSRQRFGQPGDSTRIALADHNETPENVRRPEDALFARGA
jgi:hypothetical protein